MSAADRLADGFPHGTPDGYEQGCRGRICPAEDQSCQQAQIRFASDYQYRRQVLAERARRPKWQPGPRPQHRKRQLFTAEHLEQLREFNARGWSDNRIAKQLGFSNSNVSRRRDEMGLPANFTGRPRKNP
jgi:DNA-binding NarL/FixJ family response regulator